jgi:hypothetical protein
MLRPQKSLKNRLRQRPRRFPLTPAPLLSTPIRLTKNSTASSSANSRTVNFPPSLPQLGLREVMMI